MSEARRFLRYSRWDALLALSGVGIVALLVGWFLCFRSWPWWATAVAFIAATWSYCWNLQCISHNFIHNPYFSNAWLNRAYSVLETFASVSEAWDRLAPVRPLAMRPTLFPRHFFAIADQPRALLASHNFIIQNTKQQMFLRHELTSSGVPSSDSNRQRGPRHRTGNRTFLFPSILSRSAERVQAWPASRRSLHLPVRLPSLPAPREKGSRSRSGCSAALQSPSLTRRWYPGY